MNLSHITAFVTGGAQGLGRATAIYFAKRQAKVIVADIAPSELSFVEDQGDIAVIKTDITNEEDVRAAFRLSEKNQWNNVNLIVNCAGICIPMKILSSRGLHTIDHFEKTMRINAVGTFNVIRIGAEIMAKNKTDSDGIRGCIINTASIAAYEGQIGQVAYAASKGAIISMTLPLARELSSVGIRVNTIAPGLFLTPLMEALPRKVREDMALTVPLPKRLGDPEEYAKLVAAILDNPMINGEVIRLDGGLRMPHQP